MRNRPPLDKQETNYSCGPACVRMVVESLGTVITEARVRELADCNEVSVLIRGHSDAFKLVEAARKLGFSAAKHNMGFNDLRSELEKGLFPIVNVMTRLADGSPRVEHAVVVVEINEESVIVNDPWRGEFSYARADFIQEWSQTYGLTILIARRDQC